MAFLFSQLVLKAGVDRVLIFIFHGKQTYLIFINHPVTALCFRELFIFCNAVLAASVGSKRLREIVLFLLQRLHFTTDAARRTLPRSKALPTRVQRTLQKTMREPRNIHLVQ